MARFLRIFTLLLAAPFALVGCGGVAEDPAPSPGSSGQNTAAAPASPPAAGSGADNASDLLVSAPVAEWVTHGGNYAEDRFSRLDQINAANASELGLAWAFDLGTSRGIEVTPIVHDGLMYVTGTWNVVYALDAVTGAQIWTFDPEVDRSRAAFLCCDAVNRGVAFWDGKVFTGTIDGRLIALDAKSGAKLWDVQTVDNTKPYTITGAPRVVKGKVIIGNGGAELGVRGYVGAYDAATGEALWRFYTVPGNPADGFENEVMASAAETWAGTWWEAGGGGTVWDSLAYDPELDLLYIGVGNGSPWNHQIRSNGEGDNLFLSSIVALRPDTGEYVWHYQTTPGETWDYTATQHMILADLEIDGVLRNVIMQAPKNGFFYVLDRATGEFISAENFVPVNWASHIDPETGRPVEIDGTRYGGREPYLQFPGPLGAHNWQPMSYNPQTGLVYIPAQEIGWVYAAQSDYTYQEGLWNTGTDISVNGLPDDKEQIRILTSSRNGKLVAWDPIAQEERWAQVYTAPYNGGTLSTAGGLVFQGTADARFMAYDASSGEPLWSFPTQTGVVAAPISYEIDGSQYVAIATGWGGSYVLSTAGLLPTGSEPNVGRILVFKLGSDGSLPEIPLTAVTISPPPTPTASAEVVSQGRQAYGNYCAVCHGAKAISSGLIPNLRYSAYLGDAEAWNEIVRNGALKARGMGAFGKHVDVETSEAIRAYVVEEANSGIAKEFYDELAKERAAAFESANAR